MKELKKEIEANIASQKNKVQLAKDVLKEEELKLKKMQSQLDCEHDWKIDYAIMGGFDIETCKKCGATWES